jgi:hypothetical protein
MRKEIRSKSKSLATDPQGRLIWVDPDDPNREPFVITTPPVKSSDKPKTPVLDPEESPFDFETRVEAKSPSGMNINLKDIPDPDLEAMAKLTDQQIQAIISESSKKQALAIWNFVTRLRAEYERRRGST